MRNGFAADFSWDKSAKEYLELYRGLRDKPRQLRQKAVRIPLLFALFRGISPMDRNRRDPAD